MKSSLDNQWTCLKAGFSKKHVCENLGSASRDVYIDRVYTKIKRMIIFMCVKHIDYKESLYCIY